MKKRQRRGWLMVSAVLLIPVVGCEDIDGNEAAGRTISDNSENPEDPDSNSGELQNTEPVSRHHVLGSGPLIVSGTVERELGDYTWNDPFDPVDEAHVVVTVGHFEMMDAPVLTVVEEDFPFTGLPLTFEIRGELSLPEEAALLVDFTIYNHSGTDPTIGDLADEYWDEVTQGDEDITILVSGLESCESDNAGGYCVSP